MEQTLHALAGILLKSIPTVVLLLFLYFYLKLMLFEKKNEQLEKQMIEQKELDKVKIIELESQLEIQKKSLTEQLNTFELKEKNYNEALNQDKIKIFVELK